MKVLAPILLSLLLVPAIFAQDQRVDSSALKKTERRLSAIRFKLESGMYDEAAQDARKLFQKTESTPAFLPSKAEAKLLEARSYNALFCFTDSRNALNEAADLVNKNSSAPSAAYRLLADYLQESEDPASAVPYIEKAITTAVSEKEKADALLVKAAVLYRQGFLNEALELLNQQTSYRLQSASAEVVSAQERQSLQPKADFLRRKEIYGTLLDLKSACLLAKGDYAEAETMIRNSAIWIAEHLGKHHSLYRQALEQEAEIAFIKNSFGKSASLYANAYNCQNFSENEAHRIRNLTKLALASIESGQITQTNNYVRRLQMYAFRNVGADDPFEAAYEFVQCYKLHEQGDFSASLSRIEKAIKNFSFLPENHYWTLVLTELKAQVALRSGDLKMYKQALEKLSQTGEKYYGKDAPAFHKQRLQLAIYEIRYGKDFSGAEEILKTSYDKKVKQEMAPASRENIDLLLSYAELLGKRDKYDSATYKAMEAAEITRTLFGENSAAYALNFTLYTQYQILAGRYKEGFLNLEKALSLASGLKDKDPEIQQKNLLLLSRLCTFTGEFEKSQSLLIRANKLSLSGFEKQVLAEAERAEELGALHLASGNYFKAEKYLLQSLSIKEQRVDAEHPLLIRPYEELARLNLTTGNYNNCDLYLKKALHISETVFGQKSLSYVSALLLAADYYLSIGDYKKAEEACLKADETAVSKLGKNNLNHAEILAALSQIKYKSGKYQANELENLYKEAENIVRNGIGTNTPLTALLFEKEAELFTGIGKPDKAEPLLAEAEKYWTGKLGSDNQHNAQIQLLRGDIAYNAAKYDPAEKNYRKSQQIFLTVFNENHPGYIYSSGKLARVYYMKKDFQKSLEIMEGIIPKYLDYTVNYFPSLSFREKSKFWNKMKEEFEFYEFIAFGASTKNPQLAGKVYNNIISTKALLLNSNLRIKEKIMVSQDSLLIDYYNRWLAEKEHLTRVFSLTRQQLAEDNVDPRLIEAHIEHLEREISKRSEAFSKEEKKKRAQWQDIKNTLRDKEYAVEIVRFRYFNKTFTDSVLYAALILHNKSETPELVLLPNGKQMEKKYLKLYRNAVMYKLPDNTSYSTYWKPLEDKIPQDATVFLSEDGVYYQMNVEMFADAAGKYVIEKNQIVLLTNTKDLLNTSVPAEKKDGRENKKAPGMQYLLCGNPDFYITREEKDNAIAPLPGAEQEVNEIEKMLRAEGRNPVKLLNEKVTEEALKSLENPEIFHIATHGYFKNGTRSGDEDFASNPLLNSGLMLSGSGDILSNPESGYVNQKEGILTAYEATNLKFANTQLVILSACETGLGEVEAGEGVYGLQRAFLIAGADAVIMSLFKVNDEVTRKLMATFYEKWLSSGNKRTAFVEAKRAVMQEFKSPVYWGAFIMIEGKPGNNLLGAVPGTGKLARGK